MTNSDKALIEANILGIATAVNDEDLAKYGSLVTEDFVNINKDVNGEVTSTVGRQARLDVLQSFFDHAPLKTQVSMTPLEIIVDGDHAFAHIDGILKLEPKEDSVRGFTLSVDLYLFYYKDDKLGWLSERSFGVETKRVDA